MIPYLKAQIAEAFIPEAQRATVREYLQMRILQSLQRAGAMIPLAFHRESIDRQIRLSRIGLEIISSLQLPSGNKIA